MLEFVDWNLSLVDAFRNGSIVFDFSLQHIQTVFTSFGLEHDFSCIAL